MFLITALKIVLYSIWMAWNVKCTGLLYTEPQQKFFQQSCGICLSPEELEVFLFARFGSNLCVGNTFFCFVFCVMMWMACGPNLFIDFSPKWDTFIPWLPQAEFSFCTGFFVFRFSCGWSNRPYNTAQIFPNSLGILGDTLGINVLLVYGKVLHKTLCTHPLCLFKVCKILKHFSCICNIQVIPFHIWVKSYNWMGLSASKCYLMCLVFG